MKNSISKLLLLSIISFSLIAQEIDLRQGWKFKQGDNLEWAKPSFDDNDWKDIEVGRNWEFQGYEKYDGYAWYRIKVFIPSSLKKNSTLKDSLKFDLGMIDDQDQFYLNDTKIGENGGLKFAFGNKENKPGNTAYNIHRKYTISTMHPAIAWDKVNTMSIRVFDQSGNGGMLDGKKYGISMVDNIDDIILDINSNPFQFKTNGSFSKIITLTVSSTTSINFKGKLLVEASDIITKEIKASYAVVAEFSAQKPFNFEFNLPGYENLVARYSYIDLTSGNGFSESQEVPFILTPTEKLEPKINAPKVFGVKPGSPVLFTVATSGERPITFSAENLPVGLSLDSKTGFVTGVLNTKSEYPIKFTAKNSFGSDSKTIKFICGDLITLTPQMGWNSWNCWGLAVSDEKVRASAKAMIDKGLINYGWSYMNIDDGWEDKRDEKGVLQPNSKFPNMKKLCDDLHTQGLKVGIYSSPGPQTCGRYMGSYKYEQLDINTWASWGIDYLKYDWCEYNQVFMPPFGADGKPVLKNPKDILNYQKPYKVMQNAIASVTPKRDIVYSICQYGWTDVWKWGADVNGQSWRTTGDIEDSWVSMSSIFSSQSNLYKYAKPGRWNDPDMLVVGKVGWGPSLRNSRLSVNEQYTHISMWALLAAPLLIGCDMSQLDDFTLNLLKNSEVIAINQDPLGKQAEQKIKNENFQIWVKELEDGSKAVGIFNVSDNTQKISLDFKSIGIAQFGNIRDVWKQKNIGDISIYETILPKHGVKLIKLDSLK